MLQINVDFTTTLILLQRYSWLLAKLLQIISKVISARTAAAEMITSGKIIIAIQIINIMPEDIRGLDKLKNVIHLSFKSDQWANLFPQ